MIDKTGDNTSYYGVTGNTVTFWAWSLGRVEVGENVMSLPGDHLGISLYLCDKDQRLGSISRASNHRLYFLLLLRDLGWS